jgi:serine/threonine protein kinase
LSLQISNGKGNAVSIPSDGSNLAGVVLVGQFRIQRLLGTGAMGSVYLADQLGLDRQVVVKLMKADMPEAQLAELEQRFQREGRLVAQLNHPNLVQLYTFGRSEDGRPYLAMEYVPGRTLRQVLEEDGVLPEARVLGIVDQVCSALHEAHRLGIVHRDLKPDNVMLMSRQGNPDHVKVLDFGIAKLLHHTDKTLTATGVIYGTPQYMAPEQVHARAVDQRTDIYALGLIAYELLTGQPAFDADSAMGVMMKQVSARVVPPSQLRADLRIHRRTETIIVRCLAKAVEQRFANMLELQRAVRVALLELEEQPHAARYASGSVPGMGTAVEPTRTSLHWPQRALWRQLALWVGVASVCLVALASFSRLKIGEAALDTFVESLQTPSDPRDPEASDRAREASVPADVSRAGARPGGGGITDSDADESGLARIQQKHRVYVSDCFNRLTERGYESRARYASWVQAAKGPSLRARNVYGLYATTDPESCAASLAKHASDSPDRLDAAAQQYLRAAQQLRELTVTADRYYDQGDYKDDAMARGRELHRPLLAAFASFTAASTEFAAAIDETALRLARWYEQRASDSDVALRLEGDALARDIARRGNVDWRKLQSVELGPLRTAIQRYAALLDQLGESDAAALHFLRSAKELARRVERPGWTGGDRTSLSSWAAQWMVRGSPSAVLVEYNRLDPLFEPIARRYEVPFPLEDGSRRVPPRGEPPVHE